MVVNMVPDLRELKEIVEMDLLEVVKEVAKEVRKEIVR